MNLWLFLGIFIIVSGPFIASYLAVLVVRSTTDKVINAKRHSQCLKCGHPLAWYDLVPLLSYLFLRGKCRYCGEPIGIKLFLSEILGFVSYLCVGIHVLRYYYSDTAVDIGKLLEFVLLAVFIGVLLYLAIYDLHVFAIPTNLTMYLLTTSLLASIVLNILRLLGGLTNSAIPLSTADNIFTALLLGLIIYILIMVTKQRGMGEGDVYVAALIGLYLGWPNGFMAMYLAIIIGGIVGLIYALILRRFRNILIPFVPFLLLGSALSIIIGEQLFRIIFYVV